MIQTSNSITDICNIVMRGFAAASDSGKLAQARVALGDRYVDVAVESMRRNVKALLDPTAAAENLEALNVAGSMAAQTIIAGVVADSVCDVCEAAGV